MREQGTTQACFQGGVEKVWPVRSNATGWGGEAAPPEQTRQGREEESGTAGADLLLIRTAVETRGEMIARDSFSPRQKTGPARCWWRLQLRRVHAHPRSLTQN